MYANKLKRKGQSGRSMIEMLGVLAIIGVLSAGGIAGYTMAMATFKTNKSMDMVQIISAQAKQLYGDDFTGITVATMYQLGYLSSEYLKPGSLAAPVGQSPFGSTLTIASASPYNNFTITVNDVPKAACVKLAQSYWGDSTFFVSLKGAGATLVTPAAPLTNASAAITFCSGATQNMVWTFK